MRLERRVGGGWMKSDKNEECAKSAQRENYKQVCGGCETPASLSSRFGSLQHDWPVPVSIRIRLSKRSARDFKSSKCLRLYRERETSS